MSKPANDFKRWAVSQKMDIDQAIGLGYLSERTNIPYKAWLGCMELIQGGILHDYGICPECKQHYVEKELTDANPYPAMECDCTVDKFRQTKIMQLLDDESIKRIGGSRNRMSKYIDLSESIEPGWGITVDPDFQDTDLIDRYTRGMNNLITFIEIGLDAKWVTTLENMASSICYLRRVEEFIQKKKNDINIT